MDIKDLEYLTKLMDKNCLTELELEESGEKIRLRKLASSCVVQEDGKETDCQLEVEEVVDTDLSGGSNLPLIENKDFIIIKSPRVGTFFYRSKPYVEVGNLIEKGEVVCFVKAMKLKHEVEATISGKIMSVLVNNSQPVEYGEPLFLVDPKVGGIE
ncbi:MAG: biotin/lipoyl-containing protein [bacterium]